MSTVDDGKDAGEGAGVDSASSSEGPDGVKENPQITLDRYMSRRRNPVKAPVAQIVSLVMMLITLIMVFAFKDRCGLLVSEFFGEMEAKQGKQQPAPRSPAAEDP